ncbi:MAG TPA: hypothetical protein VFM90_11045, partial [Cyclobacteriaceae bacterium]|nr:hypothetical protein [Cyclobacteriaceae bacterium]
VEHFLGKEEVESSILFNSSASLKQASGQSNPDGIVRKAEGSSRWLSGLFNSAASLRSDFLKMSGSFLYWIIEISVHGCVANISNVIRKFIGIYPYPKGLTCLGCAS